MILLCWLLLEQMGVFSCFQKRCDIINCCLLLLNLRYVFFCVFSACFCVFCKFLCVSASSVCFYVLSSFYVLCFIHYLIFFFCFHIYFRENALIAQELKFIALHVNLVYYIGIPNLLFLHLDGMMVKT